MNKDRKRIPLIVVMLGLVSLLTDSATEMIYPLIPVFVTSLGSGALALGVIEGISETTSSVIKLFSGIVSDRVGKRKILVLAGYVISSFVRPFTGLVSSAWQIVAVRLLDRVGKGIRTAPRDAMIASSADEKIRGRSFGFHRAMDHTGAVIGPVLAIITLLILFAGFGFTDSLLAMRWTFVLALIPGILAVLMLIFFVHESSPRVKAPGNISFSFKNFNRNFRAYILIVLLFTLGNSSDAFLLFRVEETIRKSGAVVDIVNRIGPLREMIFNFGDDTTRTVVINILFLPLVWAFFHIIKVIFSTPLGALSDRIGRKRVIKTGWAIYAFVYLSFALLHFLSPDVQVIATFILFAVYALFYAFTEGAEKAFVADLVAEDQRGSAFGIYNFAIGLGALPASLIFGFLYSFFDTIIPGYGATVAFSFGASLAIVSMILLTLRVREPERKKS